MTRLNDLSTRSWTAGRRTGLRAATFGLALAVGAAASHAGAAAGDQPRAAGDTLYGLDGAVEGVRIGWHIDDVLSAYEEAVARNLPLVIVFAADWCDHCWTLVDEALTCASVNRHSGHAVFVYTDTSRDTVAAQLADRLDIDAVPVVSVLAPDASGIVEHARLNGTFPGDTLAQHLTRILAGQGWPVPAPGAVSGTALFTPMSQTSVDPAACAATG